MNKKIFISLIILTIITVNILRLWQLDNVPYGFNVDEMAMAVTVTCLETEGVDAHQHPHPVFSDINYGAPIPAVYTYPAVVWAKFFGHKADSFRRLTAFFNILTVLGLFFLAKTMMNNSYYGLMAALLASLSPWLWGPSRIGYEATTSVTFFVWGIFCFIRREGWWSKICAGLLFACAVYAYTPARMQVPFIIATLLIFNLKDHKFRKEILTGFFAVMLFVCVPLIQQTLNGKLVQHFNNVSIFNPDYLKTIGKTGSIPDLLGIFINNYLQHFTVQYLFISGDPSLEHSTQHFGLLSWLEVLGFLSLVFFLVFQRKDTAPDKKWIMFLTVNFLFGIVPASLTDMSSHVSLRTIGACPFAFLLAAYGLWKLCERWRFFLPVTAILGIVFAFAFLRVYFTVYPQESKGWFSFWTKEEALQAKTDQDWLNFMVRYQDDDYHFRYYLINYHGESCSSSLAKWIKLRELLHLPKAY